jgi:hypothetical protein
MHEEVYLAFAKRLDPLIGKCERTWVMTKGGRFLAFECQDRTHNLQIRLSFWSIGSKVRRKARLKKAPGHHLPKHLEKLWEIQRGRCYFSGIKLGESFVERKFSVDHLYPIATRPPPYCAPQGTHWPINLALVATKVNQGKGSRTPAEYLAEVKRSKSYTATTATERRRVDKLRHQAFREYMQKHCSEDPNEWGPA